MTRSILLLLLLLLACIVPGRSIAAQSYDNCTGFIDTLPASITAQGTWCLRKHLYTSVAAGPAISVLTDNVTIDCNDHRLSGLGAGDATEAVGINTGASRSNATVRNCRIQGFKYGVVLHGTNHLVERNRFEGNTFTGIHVSGRGLVIRQNVVADTGGRPNSEVAQGIYAGEGRVLGNTVSGVSPAGNVDGKKSPVGIHLDKGVVGDNRVSGLVTNGGLGIATGIRMTGAATARDNYVTQAVETPGHGIRGGGPNLSICRQNDIVGFPPNQNTINCLAYQNNQF